MTTKIRDFWSGMPAPIRVSLIAITGSLATILALKAKEMTTPKIEPESNAVYWDEKDLRKIVRQEIAPLDAGFRAFVATQPAKSQLAVLKAIEAARPRD